MKYVDLINDSRFNFLLEKYLNKDNTVNYIEYFNHFIDNLNDKEIIIPVLGIQGAGKSSFLNSILMEDNILPTDVDETTCVPVEVRYGEDTEKAIVHFLDKECKEIKLCDLEKYVHNDYNMANELKVSKIILYNKSDVLKNNVVLVDLPGVGSLTPENQRTTLDYVNKLVSGIFMLRTNPPITRTERNFINALWPKLSNTIFVQNKWNDENDEDALEAKEHNEYVLNSICEEHNESKEINVNVVNVYEAVKGKFTKDDALYKDSGIVSVIENIGNVSKEYNIGLEKSLNSKIVGALENINYNIEEYKTLCLNEKKQNDLNKEEKIKEIKSILLDNKKNFRRIRVYAYDEMEKIIDYASGIIKEKITNLRANLKGIINRGIVDGERLSSIYKESSDKAINDIMDEVLDKTSELIKNLNKELNGITIKGFYGDYENISFFNKESEFKFEKSLPSLLGVSGGVIGALGTVGALGGPLGILVGMGIGMAFSLIGDFVRKEILETRANYTLRDLEPMIEDLENYLKEEILDDLRAKQQDMDDSIKELRKNLENSFKDDIQIIEKQYDYTYSENNILEFEDDLKILNEVKEDVGLI
ncbi:dynamin family protein [Clostridium botulinum]|uniref:dynamin family protein n=1 Tax=unclassified Clostridium TaxID=2614128 RepID=UPI0005085868|nr:MULTISPECIES: dynamin family protein [unclassified Clostridium]AIY82084.1 50S ribosome-binding GTPase family protein [Clostridium botulinum 202F]KAI3348907.1 dynamin family protein [Clostridium botulinum]KFX57651.1 dynamin family protein [Clostridium botulinum]KON12295.1 dynamin family protein [Clostridium botulinum]MBY6778248.1 dynamin family protein [Clostridium botulinum]